MDALEFYSTQKRYCRETACQDCRIYAACGGSDENSMISFVNFIEKWSKEHPVKTRQTEFLKQFPNAVKSKEDFIGVCPCLVDTTHPCRFCTTDDYTCCDKCKKDYWSEEV